MKITVEIECETIQEFSQHLSVLKRQITKKAKREKRGITADEFIDAGDLDDSNCYGEHQVTIIPENSTIL